MRCCVTTAWRALRAEAERAERFPLDRHALNVRMLSCLLAFSAGTCLAGDLFRWLDTDGTVHYSDRPPTPSAKDIQEKTLGANVIKGNPSYQMEQATKNFPVMLYVTDCGADCSKARRLLRERRVLYSEKNPTKQRETADALKKIAADLLVPVPVVDNSQTLKGFDENAWNNALDAVGYPKIPVPAPAPSAAATKFAATILVPPSMSATPAATKSNYSF